MGETILPSTIFSFKVVSGVHSGYPNGRKRGARPGPKGGLRKRVGPGVLQPCRVRGCTGGTYGRVYSGTRFNLTSFLYGQLHCGYHRGRSTTRGGR